MKMTLRWFGKDHDSVSLEHIRQIPGVTGVVTSLLDIPVGDIWSLEEIMERKLEVESYGLKIEGIESVNIHENIKLGLPSRDKYITNYIETIKNLSKADIHLICYNFMPVFDWTRSDLAKRLEDNSTVLSYEATLVENIDPMVMVSEMEAKSSGYSLPGWEPERLKDIKVLFDAYKEVSEEDLFENLKYFLKAIIPACEKYDVKMAIHPDDPPWPIFGLPRIMNCEKNIDLLLEMVDSPYNGLTLCTGSLGANKANDIPKLIRKYGNRIHFAHIRNIKFHEGRDFDESAHLSSKGSLDMYEIMKAYHEIDFQGIMRPDHGRMIWDEVARPGYGLYDRAIGASYLLGLSEAIDKLK
ncbi:MAG: mannonate dehydratase [Firmicutes bacterium HGW-Firmicutes-7]|nr:MAG: mannonate dehydratase [Firmicutes bacterium HGW-Firmicutes-7]